MRKNYRVTVNGQSYDVVVEEAGGSAAPAYVAPAPAAQPAPAPAPAPAAAPVAAPAAAGPAGANTLKAPMPGTVVSVKVTTGQAVRKGDIVLILEAMKMENEIVAAADGTVGAIRVQTGTAVNTGDPLLDIC